MAKQVSEYKLHQSVETYINGNISDFWSEVKSLSRRDRDRLIGVVYDVLGPMNALRVARRIVSGEFK